MGAFEEMREFKKFRPSPTFVWIAALPGYL